MLMILAKELGNYVAILAIATNPNSKQEQFNTPSNITLCTYLRTEQTRNVCH